MKTIPAIYGFNKTSEAGIKVFAPSVFIQGCNLKCPFCFNAILAKSQMKKEDEVPLERVDAFIKREKPEMIMISGGEPLMLKNIGNLIDHFRAQGMKIGLSTHGIYPDRLMKLLGKIDYVALDIKSHDPKVYEFLDLIKDNNSYKKMGMSRGLLQNEKSNARERDGFDYEVRTTLYPPYITMESIHGIGASMPDNCRWVLQQYRPTKRNYDMVACEGVEPYDFDTLQEMLKTARLYTKEAQLRYV